MSRQTFSEEMLRKVKEDILSLGSALEDAEAVGICGSLARGDFGERSDIDIFVILDGPDFQKREEMWHKRVREALGKHRRDLTIIVYSLKGLRRISNWYIFSLASDGITVYDKGRVGEIFKEIMRKTKEWNLVKKKYGRYSCWTIGRVLEPGEVVEFTLEKD